ncbi:MAG: hemerythrin domain-containing protein [Frankiaceae bacterium]|nr:hemerythrin domain-containing protein [Frankiaceae bacterium]
MSQNGIDFLRDQHRTVETLLDAVSSASPTERGAKFDELRELLAVHETAEELILRPLTRAAIDNGNEIADARFAEENEAKQVLADLEKLDASTGEFLTKFESFAIDVRKHAQNEETYEFAQVEESQDEAALGKLGTALAAAEKAAPTHPHPSAKTTTANLVLGPFASIVDRVRDAIKQAS